MSDVVKKGFVDETLKLWVKFLSMMKCSIKEPLCIKTNIFVLCPIIGLPFVSVDKFRHFNFFSQLFLGKKNYFKALQ